MDAVEALRARRRARGRHRRAVGRRLRDRPDPLEREHPARGRAAARAAHRALGLPVFVDNDASCAALAEAFEDGRFTCPDLVMFTIGTGVGGGTVLGGSLYRGATGAAPEIGHQIIGMDLLERRRVARVGLPAAGLAGGAGLGTRAGPARARRRPPRPATRSSASGSRPTARSRATTASTGAKEGDEAALRCLRDPRRAARDRHRQRDQHLRSARGRDRRRRLATPATCCSSRPSASRSGTWCPGWAPAPRSGSRATARARACSARR